MQWKFGKSEWCWFWKHTHCVFCFSNAPTKWVVCAECCFCPSSWHHLLILKTPPHQQMVSLRRTETTNCAVTEHNPHQQMCWSTKWVGRPDCCFWHPFTFLVTPTSTKWATDPICLWWSPRPFEWSVHGKVNHYNRTKQKDLWMGPSVKFILAIINSVSQKKWAQNINCPRDY